MKYLRLIGLIAVAIVALLVGAGSASAADCGQPAVYKTVTTPATVAVYEDQQVLVSPEIPGQEMVPEVSHMEPGELISPAVEAVPSQWWNWAPSDTKGPQDYEPAFPVDERGKWVGPHAEGGPDGEGTFNVSNGNSGNSSWFHRDPAIEGKDAVYGPDVKVVDSPAIPGFPATPAVYRTESVLVKAATEATTTQVLVSEATKACPAAVTPVNHPRTPTSTPVADTPELAFTGSQTTQGALTAAALVGFGLLAYRLRRRLV